MHPFDVLGWMAVVLGMLCSVLLFVGIRYWLPMPWWAALPGALVAGVGVFMLAGWAYTAGGIAAILLPDFPGVSWQSGAGLLAVAVCWYQLVYLARRFYRKHQRLDTFPGLLFLRKWRIIKTSNSRDDDGGALPPRS